MFTLVSMLLCVAPARAGSADGCGWWLVGWLVIQSQRFDVEHTHNRFDVSVTVRMLFYCRGDTVCAQSRYRATGNTGVSVIRK